MKIAFIGGGVMAEAIIGGILGQGIATATDICVGEPVESRRAALSDRYGVSTTASNGEAAGHGQLVVLSVKPQQLDRVLGELRGKLEAGQAVISIIAGARMNSIVAGLEHEAVIRVMPNTPAQIGVGMSVWTASPSVNGKHTEATRSILETLGEELYVDDERYIDMATALSASGPAYVFLFIESLVDAGVTLGMTPEMARKLTLQTVLGSARLVQETGKDPAELRDMVTSPGGTTAEALRALEAGGFRATVLDAVTAAYEKAKQLGEEK
ncbi:MAG: pyrroline-5-carboxylate reductase [Chloroflexi bacterium]|nr:pyrroline-5-carboxylate reductase [Chloroflexota bacterium]